MTDETDLPETGEPDAGEPLADSPPYVISPRDTSVKNGDVTVVGGGHARRNVRVVTPGKEDYRSDEMQMGGDGQFRLRLRTPLAPGHHHLQVLQWESDRESIQRTPEFYVSVMPKPVVRSPSNGANVGVFPLPVVTGDTGAPYAQVTIHRSGDGNTVYGEGVVDTSGNWRVQLVKALPGGSFRVACRQTLHGFASDWGDPGHVWTVTLPTISSPLPNAFLPTGSGSFFRGSAEPGWTVEVVDAANLAETIGSVVVVDGTRRWACPVILTLPTRTVAVKAKYSLANLSQVVYSEPLTCKILGTPTITRPTGVVDTTFSVPGTNGFQGAVVDIYTDLSNTHHGQVGVVTAPGWSRFITVDPGVVTLVAQQTIQGVSSLRGTPVTFKVRPSRLTSVSVAALADSGLRFSGAGHKNATVDVIKLSGPGSQTIPPVTVSNNGTWSVDSANWPLGRYSFKATQKVPDNIGGWIVSSEYTFSYTIELPRPTVDYTGDYTPVFSGTGYTGAAVVLYGPAGGNKVAPDAQVSGGRWSSTASAEWGPTFKRKVDLRQELNGHVSGWEELEVTIAPLPPVITEITGGDDSQLSPTIKGTCWIEAVVNLVYSDAPTIVHPVTMTNGNWTHRRATPFTPNVTHTVTVTQTAGQQTSLPASRTFQVSRALHKPVITSPVREAEVARDLTVRGQLGVAGASMQLRVDGINAAPPQQLITDGEWSIALTGLAFGRRIFDAQQTLDGRPSELSDPVAVMVVLMPPVFTVPLPGGKVPRAATIAGKGTPGAKVQVWEEGREDLLLMEVPVGFDGCWEGAVNLPVGVITLQARQTMEAQKEASGESSPVTCDVVPDAPWIETPVKDGEIGRVTVVSGFGEPGDTITISLDDAAHTVLGSTPVLEDRTWSVAVTLTQPAGAQALVAVASLDGFESDRCARQPVVLGSYSPVIDTPQAGRWVAEPVNFSGQGRRGTGEVTSWYNPEYVWAPALAVSAQGWQGWSVRRLSAGGNWCRFKQTIVDGADGSTISDWVQSQRFEVPGPPPR